MAYGLIGAGLMAGVGKGFENVSQALGQGVQIAGLGWLNRQRQDAEMARLKVMEAAATSRQQAGFAHDEAMQQQRTGADIVNRSLDRQAQADLEKNRQDFQAGRDQANLGGQMAVETMRGERDERQHQERMAVEKGQAKAQEAHYNATQQHYQQMEAIARLQHGDEVRNVLNPDEEGRHFAVMKSGKTVELTDPKTGKPIIGAKGLSDSAKHLADLYKDRSATLDKLASDPLTPPEDAQRLRQESQDLFQRAASIFGEKHTAVAEGPAIKDRFKASAPASPRTPGESAPPPRREKTLPAEPSQPLAASPTDAFTWAGEKVTEGARGLIDSARSAFMPNAPAPTVAKESRAQATAALKGGTPDQVMAEKRQEAQQREQQIAKPRSGGLISMSEASVPPVSRPVPQERPQPQERSTPQATPAPQEREQATQREPRRDTDLYAGQDEVFAQQNMQPTDVFNSSEFAALPDHKQYNIRRLFQQYQQGDLSGDVLTSSMHALLDDSWGMIRAEMVARVLTGKGKKG